MTHPHNKVFTVTLLAILTVVPATLAVMLAKKLDNTRREK